MRLDISFDDGHIDDMRAVQLLLEYDLPATFYVTDTRDKDHLGLEDIIYLHKTGFEIGGHTMNHPMDLKKLSDDDLSFEICQNKWNIELLITDKEITKFCYPRGRHDERVREVVKKAGYKEARTTLVHDTDYPAQDPLQTHTSVHMAHRNEYQGRDWLEEAKTYFQVAKQKGGNGVFRLWGHSWELTENGEWDKFEELLEYINENRAYISNTN